MWQKYRIRVTEWIEMTEEERMFYIASESVSADYPINPNDRLAKVYIKNE